MLWLSLFAALSLILLVLSWSTLRTPSRRGPLRFLAFEALLGLIVLGAPAWFDDPWSARQVASWALLAASAGLAIHGFVMLHRHGGESEGGIETTRHLVERGAYRVIRHPLYGSLLLAGVGAWLKRPTAWGGVVVLILAGLLGRNGPGGRDLRRFGGVLQYMRRAWRLFWIY
jgi:protein-S-isoprenylcysteine O-methyltransferase Ste14